MLKTCTSNSRGCLFSAFPDVLKSSVSGTLTLGLLYALQLWMSGHNFVVLVSLFFFLGYFIQMLSWIILDFQNDLCTCIFTEKLTTHLRNQKLAKTYWIPQTFGTDWNGLQLTQVCSQDIMQHDITWQTDAPSKAFSVAATAFN